ncbi:hypothetical protein [uncultured Brevundimonas sp.]|uniref:hypothetical protein n=1 Tax=uncultured Brevundimonas sp. TaxID=213418 RepID=UPI00262BC5DE|nr:hypothetical protein [uncultured Brevundimonas sp.]
MAYTSADLKGFAEAAHSLKLYRRADLSDYATDKTLIDKLYVDPLQHDAVLETMLRDSTTFLIGRKGTGKSTVFQRAQHQLRSRKNSVSAYIDIKTVYEAADVDPALPTQLTNAGINLSDTALKRVLLYRSFIRAVFEDVKVELKKQVSSNLFDRLFDKDGAKRSDLVGAIDELLDGSFEAQFTDVGALRTIALTVENERSGSSQVTSQLSGRGEANLTGVGGQIGGSKGEQKIAGHKEVTTEEYSRIVLRTFNINKIIEDLEKLLHSIGIRKLYIFVDDFSELPEEAMNIFVDAVLAPLNNWSNELIKFKIAAYPGRIYLGKIDPTKIDEVYLDLYKLYGDRDVGTMEERATDFTRRLVDSRFKQFVGKSFSEFCEGDVDAVYRQLFYASMANPRILGHVLTNLRDAVVAYQQAIGVRVVQDAAAKYYAEKIEPFFGVQKFSHASFSERASVFSLKELLEEIVSRAKTLRDYKESKVTRDISGRTPSSHFHISKSLDASLRTLELNFFLTLYYEMKDRDGNVVSVYALNYGLCQQQSISFGRPAGQREYRLYFVERIFDYTPIVRRFLSSNQEIKCDNCGVVFDLENLSSLIMYDMECPKCRVGKCEVINLSKKYENVLKSVDPNLLLPSSDLGMLETLYTENREMVASEIAGELDCSYQLIGKRGRILEQRGLVARRHNDDRRRVFELTTEAKDEYFVGNDARALQLPDDVPAATDGGLAV